jgi:hypothetical protein
VNNAAIVATLVLHEHQGLDGERIPRGLVEVGEALVKIHAPIEAPDAD